MKPDDVWQREADLCTWEVKRKELLAKYGFEV
jgi:hypothetical protein